MSAFNISRLLHAPETIKGNAAFSFKVNITNNIKYQRNKKNDTACKKSFAETPIISSGTVYSDISAKYEREGEKEDGCMQMARFALMMWRLTVFSGADTKHFLEPFFSPHWQCRHARRRVDLDWIRPTL